jgi:hypothetical protein
VDGLNLRNSSSQRTNNSTSANSIRAVGRGWLQARSERVNPGRRKVGFEAWSARGGGIGAAANALNAIGDLYLI